VADNSGCEKNPNEHRYSEDKETHRKRATMEERESFNLKKSPASYFTDISLSRHCAGFRRIVQVGNQGFDFLKILRSFLDGFFGGEFGS